MNSATPIRLQFACIHPFSQLPCKSKEEDFGYDLFLPEDVIIDPMQKVKIDLGIKSSFPSMWGILLQDKSSIADQDCFIVGRVMDSGFRNTWKVMMWNLGDAPRGFVRGQKIAQFVLLGHINAGVYEVSESELPTSKRGSGAFGSTGRF